MIVKDKVFAVTGAGGGIGGELVLALLDQGARVAAIDLKDNGLQEIKRRSGVPASKLSLHVADITSKTAVATLPLEVIKAHGQVDALVNCAGIIQPFVRVQDLDYEAIDRVMNVNFYGTLFMTKAFLPELLQRPEAYLANVSSMGGFLPVPGQAVYGASKAAVKLMTEGLYAELLDTPVHVSIVFPGATNTHISENSHVTPPSISGDAKKLQANMLEPAKAASIILHGIQKNKQHIYTGSDSKLMNRLYRLNPVFATKFIAKQMRSLLQK